MSISDNNWIQTIQSNINRDDRNGGSFYKLDAVLGHGGMGAVFLSHLQPLGVLRALKVLRVPEDASPPVIEAAEKRFLREARIMGNLRHPAAIKALDYQVHYCKHEGLKASFPYLMYAMEPCLVTEKELSSICDSFHVSSYTDVLKTKWEEIHGSLSPQSFLSLSLQSFLDAGCRRFPERTVARFARELISVLRAAHEQIMQIGDEQVEGVVHRDVKPSNILVGSDGRLRLTDFGISKTTSASTDEADGAHPLKSGEPTMSKGTPTYAAPEQWNLDGDPVSREADYYSLGVVLYQLLTGCSLEELGKATTSGWMAPSTHAEGISTHWDVLLCGMLIPYPDMRIADPDLLDYEFAEIEKGRG